MIKRKTNGSSCVIVKLLHKPHRKDNAFAMNTVTQIMKFRQSLLSYAEKHGVTQAAIKYNVNPDNGILSGDKIHFYCFVVHLFVTADFITLVSMLVL